MLYDKDPCIVGSTLYLQKHGNEIKGQTKNSSLWNGDVTYGNMLWHVIITNPLTLLIRYGTY